MVYGKIHTDLLPHHMTPCHEGGAWLGKSTIIQLHSYGQLDSLGKTETEHKSGIVSTGNVHMGATFIQAGSQAPIHPQPSTDKAATERETGLDFKAWESRRPCGFTL